MSAASNNIAYIPPTLQKKVSVITKKPLTLIVAGSGFGKTTAVANYLDCLPQETACHWYTCFGEPPERAWEGICRLIASADAQTGDYLSKLDLPSVNHLGYISSLMGELTCEHKTVLVIDNFQLAAFPAPCLLVEALAMHRSDKLHIVILSHPLYPEKGVSFNSARIHYISQKEFCFTPADTVQLFSLNDVLLSEEQAERLCTATEGWIAALKLHLAGFRTGGTLPSGADIHELMELTFWQELSEQQQRLFLGLSLLDTFTQAQAALMMGRDIIPDDLWAAVRGNAFVRSTGSEYTLHSLLKGFLGAKLQTQSAGFRKKMYVRAGTACQAQGKNIEAVQFFLAAEDDMGALSVPLTSLQLYELVRNKTEDYGQLLSRCHIELLESRCQLLLSTASQAALNGKSQLARTAIARLKQLQGSHDAALSRRAAGTLEIVASFSAYNDFSEMERHQAAAIELLGEEAQDFDVTNNSWTFNMPSVVYMFWRESGLLNDTVSSIRRSIPNYAFLAGEKGTGSPETMAAETSLLRGDIDESVTQSYLACTLAQRAGQDSLVFCIHVLLARVAILRGDASAFQASVRAIESLAFTGRESLCVTSSETALGFLYFLLDLEDQIPGWLCSEASVQAAIYHVSTPFAAIITLRYLRKHTPEALLGTADAFILETDAQHHLLPKLYYLMEQAALLEQQHRREEALARISSALSLALPDGVILPFAEYYGELAAALNDPRLCCGDAESLRRIHTLGHSFVNGASAVRAAFTGASPLTRREREIALMAQRNTPTKRIAERLGISPATVKNTLSKVYAKLNIGGKADLEGMQL